MNQMIIAGKAGKTIDSQELLAMVNEARCQCGEPAVRNNKFIEKIMDELEGEDGYTKSATVPPGGGTPMVVITMTIKQALRVAARESKAVRRSLVDKLEDMQSSSIPTSFSEALQLAADQARQLELAAPKVEFVDRYVDTSAFFSSRQTAKLLNIREPEFKSFLMKNEVIYILGKAMSPYQRHIDAGRCVTRTGTSEGGHSYIQFCFTPKGFERVSAMYRKQSEGKK